MAQTTMTVCIDEEMKKGFEEFCENIGLNLSAAVNMFVKAVIEEQRLPLGVYSDRFGGAKVLDSSALTTEQLDAEIERGMESLRAGRVVTLDAARERIQRLYRPVYSGRKNEKCFYHQGDLRRQGY